MTVTESSPPSPSHWARDLVCARTGVTAPLDAPAFAGSERGPWMVRYDLDGRKGDFLRSELPARPWSMWRYRELLPVAEPGKRVDLGEGGTPLVRLGRSAPADLRVWFKEEAGNPCGSFKARGLSLAINRARELGAPGVELPSAGNAAIAAAAYAAAAGLPCRVAVPADTPPSIPERCRFHGAEVLTGGSTLVESGAQLAETNRGFWNIATLNEPYRIEGKKTMGYEVAEQFGWQLPDWILYPTGGGTGLIGMHRAFDQLEELGFLDGPERPRLVSVQMKGCAPIVKAFEEGREAAEPWAEARTRVWGLRVPRGRGDFLVLRALRETDGMAVAVDESEISGVQNRLAKEEGRWVGPEGAACFVALQQLAGQGVFAPGDRVVLFQTGNPANYE